MPLDLAPILRKLALGALILVVAPFALMMKGGGFRGESLTVVFLIGGLLFVGMLIAFAILDSGKVRNASLPNPLHPANKPSEPPSA